MVHTSHLDVYTRADDAVGTGGCRCKVTLGGSGAWFFNTAEKVVVLIGGGRETRDGCVETASGVALVGIAAAATRIITLLWVLRG